MIVVCVPLLISQLNDMFHSSLAAFVQPFWILYVAFLVMHAGLGSLTSVYHKQEPVVCLNYLCHLIDHYDVGQRNYFYKQ